MNENIALNGLIPLGTDDADYEEQGDLKQARMDMGESLSTLEAKTLDWDAPLPEWVIGNYPDIIV